MAIDLQTLMSTWQTNGVYTIALPALLIFAFVFGVLSTSHVVGRNKGVQVIISLVIALLAIQATVVQQFIIDIFGRAGIAIAVVLVAIILTAMFIPDDARKGWYYGMMGLGGLAFIFVVFNAFADFNWLRSGWWGEWGGTVVFIVVIVGILAAMLFGKSEESRSPVASPMR